MWRGVRCLNNSFRSQYVYTDTILCTFSEMTCRPLPSVRDGSVYPPSCTAGDVGFGTTCSVTCHAGYSLIGPHSKQCLPEGVWSPATVVNQCIGMAAWIWWLYLWSLTKIFGFITFFSWNIIYIGIWISSLRVCVFTTAEKKTNTLNDP